MKKLLKRIWKNMREKRMRGVRESRLTSQQRKKKEVVLSEENGMSIEKKSELEGKEKREGNEIRKVFKVEREKQEGLSKEEEKNFSERKEVKGEENSCDFVQPYVERPFERGGEAQEMIAKDPIGFQHEFSVYNMEFPKGIAKLEPLHKRIKEIEYDIDDYAFQLGGKRHEIYEKRHEIYEKRHANELNLISSLIQVSNEFSCDKLLEFTDILH
ncbi:protein PXR1-like [Nicotiana tomentosiformis]|uniref:protein PXR1-like n=1 Tax=Nicotiana tomentosiformis TaxID=4098 RepID=UPI00388C3A5B